MSKTRRGLFRSAARLAAVQAAYQRGMEGTPLAQLLHEFHQHRLGAIVEGAEYHDAEVEFFDDLVKGAVAREGEIRAALERRLPAEWRWERLDRALRAILEVATYELLARPDVTVRTVVNEYLDVADAFYERREKGFVNAVLDAVAKDVRGTPAAA